jgi:hypothetical protein
MSNYNSDELPSDLDAITAEELAVTDKFVVEDESSGEVKSITKDELDTLYLAAVQALGLERIQGFGLFGTGVDSSVTISTNTTLTRDMHYNILTINAGITLYTGGFRIFAWEIAGSGTISDAGLAGGNASGGTKGSKNAGTRAAGYLPAPNKGADGGNSGANGSAGTAAANSIATTNGLAGKNSGSKTGGAAGAITAALAIYGSMRNYFNLTLWRNFDVTGTGAPTGNAGNGGSAGGASGGGGASGDNGGFAMVFARTISGTITITVIGGAGGNGASDGSGGDGGNGGIIGFVYHSISGSIAHVYTGGAGGSAGGGSGSLAGDTGLTGILISLQL